MASLGSKVLQVRSVELAMVHGVRTFVRSSFDDPEALPPGHDNQPRGTLICDEDEIVEKQVVSGNFRVRCPLCDAPADVVSGRELELTAMEVIDVPADR